MTPRVVRPFCAAGCGQRVKRKRTRWCSQACVPRSVRAEAFRRGRETYAYRRRARVFAEHLARLHGRAIRREDLLAVFMAIHRRGYNSGYQAGRAAHVEAA